MDTEKLNSLNLMFDNIAAGREPDAPYGYNVNTESVMPAPVYTPSVEQDANTPGNVENVNPLPAPEQPEQKEEKSPVQKAHEINAWKKYMGNTEETLLEAKKLVEGTNISENDFLGDDDCTKTVREYMEEKSRNADFKAVFQDDPAISKLVAEGKELPAAIAAHNLNDVKKQYDLIQTVKNQLRADEIRNQLNIMGTTEALGGKDIDWNKVKELQEEYKNVSDLPSITDDPVTAIIAGAAGQMPQMGRSAITALKYGVTGLAGGAVFGAAAGTIAPGVGNAVGATAMGVKAGSVMARVGWFKGSFDEMFGYNYLQLRSEKDDRGVETYSRDSARAYAVAQAAVSAGIENYNTGAILNYLGKGKGIAAKEIKDIVMGAASKESAMLALERFVKTSLPEFFKHVGEEVGEEALQSLSDDTIKNLSTITNKRAQGVGLGQMAENAAENAIEAIPASIGLVGAGKIGSMPRAAKQAIRLLEIQGEQAQKDVHTANGIGLIGQLKEHINNSEFFKKSPEVASEVLAKNLEGSGFETVYVDTMALKEQEGGEQLIREAAEKAGKSEEEINSILANDTDFSVPTQTFLQTSLAEDEKGKYCITFQNGADSFARKQIMAEAARSEMQIVTEIEAQQKAEAQDLIANENFEEGDRAEALRLMDQYEGGIVSGINNEIKKLTAAAQAILNPYISEANNWSQQDMFSAMPIYDAKRKKWGIYTDFDGNMVNAANYDPALHGELEGWEFTEIARGPQWAENFRQIYGHFPNAFETRQALLDALEGNNGLDMLAGASEEEQEFRQAQAEEYRSTIEKVAQLNRIRDTFKNIGGDEAVITRGLSKEGYQVYKMAADAIKNAATPEAREAARYSAVILARHADAVARYVREAGKEDYTALDYINDRVKINPDGEQENAKGKIDFAGDKAIITLMQTADQSTFIHETGHLALADLKMLAEMEGAPEQILKDWQTVKEWLGYKDDQKDFTVKQQEQFARGFEAYLRSGEAPAAGLKKVFRKFKTWLTKIYSDFIQLGGEPSREVKDVMSRMLATQEEIELQMTRQHNSKFLRDGGLDFLAPSEQDVWVKWMQECQAEAEEKVMAEAMKDIKADQQERLKEYEDNIAQFRKMSQEELEQDEDWQKLMGIVAVLNETEKENHKEALAAFGYTLGKFDQAIYDRTGVTYSGQLIRSDNETTAEQFTELAVEHSLREQVEGYMQLQNEIAKENIKAMAKEAVASGEYADRLEEFMLGAVEKKRQAEERIGAFAEDKFAELEKELSGIDSKAEPEKVSKQIAALKQRIADLKYTIRWNKAEHNTALEKLEKTVADLERANASITSKASKTEERLNNKIASLQQEVKDLKGTIRWNEAENRIVFDIEKGRIKAEDQKKIDKLNEVIAGLNQEIADLKYTLRWNEAESKLMQEMAAGEERAKAEKREAKLKEYIAQMQDNIREIKELRAQDLTGIKQVRDATRGFVQAVRQQANVVMDNAVIKDDILTDKTWERKAVYEGQMMLKEMSKRNWTEAAQHKRNQIIYAEYAKAARKRARALEKKTARLQQKMKSLKKYSQVSADYRYAFEKLMFDVGLSKRNPFEEGRRPDSYNGIQGVINSLREDGIALDEAFDWMDEFRPDDIVEFLESLRDYKDLTYSQFLSFERFMNMVYKAGRQEFVTNKDGQKVLASNVAAQIQQEAAENLETLEGAGERRINQKRDFLTNVARRARKLRAEIVQMETLLSQMGKTAHEYIYDRINDAALRELRASAEYTQRFKELLNSTLKDSKEFLDGKYQLNDEVFSGREVLAIALNWGTESNKQRVLDSWNLKESDVIELLSNLGDNEWAFVEGVWGMFDEMWPQMKAVQINITGGVPKRENAVAFTIIDKNHQVHEIKGGYYPIRYDSTQSVKAAQQVQINNLKAASGTNLSRNAGTGMMKERVARTQDMVLSTDINLIPSMINQNLHFIHMREAYLDASRLVKDGDFQKTVINAFGQDAYMELDRWLNDQWAPEPKVNDDLVWALKAARQNMTLGVLGFRMTTALINVANIATVSHYVGAGNALRAIKNYYKHSLENGVFGVNPIREAILEKSVFMQERAATMDRDMRSVITDVNADNVTKLKAAQSEIIEKSFWFITQTDLMLALPLWQAEYERVYQEANIEGRTEEQIEADAIRAGDAAVRKCFGSGLRQDLNHYQRGGEIAKMFTTFYSYFAVIHNAVDRSFYESRRRYNKDYAGAPMGIKEWAKAAAPTISAIFWLYLMQSVLDAVTRQALNVAKGDDFDWEKFQKKTATNVVDNALGAVPLMREVAPRMMDAVLGERTNDFRIPFFDTANNLTKIWNAAADPKKDAAEVMYAIAEFTSRSTGISETALKAIPTTFRYLNNLERFSFQQYAGALLQAQTLKEHKKKK